ncbi:hypothetical protein [Ruegeria arenilitoris]|uniref:hypothetical protein n=1 Tax=Ruegeria arenilitoris TaxID=1173585 RepID=UPI00147A8416|nr:hypothetical protein [Ruegeria arenilitoris]
MTRDRGGATSALDVRIKPSKKNFEEKKLFRRHPRHRRVWRKMHGDKTMQTTIEASKLNALGMLTLIPEADLALAVGYPKVSSKFRAWCKQCGIREVPGRPRFFDPKLVRQKLDEVQGISEVANLDKPLSLVEARRARRVAR